jgi:hypothetical protein
MRLRTPLVLVLALGATLLAPGEALAQTPKLTATVGPGFTIRLTGPTGQAVTQLDPGTYEIVVSDLSEEHNFHLQGPGVNETTSLEFVGTVTWTVTFREGRYTFVCDPHSGQMQGSFVAGDPPPPPPPLPPKVQKLVATVGPRATITLRNAKGGHLHGLKPGLYTIVVRDRSKLHNVHLAGAGINRKTTRAGTGTVTWKVRLRKGTLRYYSDASPKKLKGSVRVS